ncbi:MAG TPA: methyltransferase [Bacteroidetes bacterium]|nr:methyltransferase [Bacteroidota bacterium]
MTSRERILTTIQHKEPDRVPVDFGSTPSSGISAIAYSNLINYLGYRDLPVRVYDVVQQLAEPDEKLLDLFEIDVIDVGRAYNTDPNRWYDMHLSNGAPAQYPVWFRPEQKPDGSWKAFDKTGRYIARMPAGGTFFDQVYFPYYDGYPASYKDLAEIMDTAMWGAFPTAPWDRAREEDFWPNLRKTCIDLKKNTDRALMLGAGCNLFEWGTFLRRMDNFLMDLILQPEEVERLLDALMEIHMDTLEKICHWVGDVVDIVRFGDDLGTQQGPFMNPEIYHKLFKPRHTQLAEYVHKNSSMHTYLHSCGSIYQMIPDLIEAGIEILNPVQTNAADMEPERLKKEFGKDLTFWGGGIETAYVLNVGTPEEVRKMVLERLEIFSPGGGYVFNTVHNILPEVPPENIMAMFNAIREFNGQNPIIL